MHLPNRFTDLRPPLNFSTGTWQQSAVRNVLSTRAAATARQAELPFSSQWDPWQGKHAPTCQRINQALNPTPHPLWPSCCLAYECECPFEYAATSFSVLYPGTARQPMLIRPVVIVMILVVVAVVVVAPLIVDYCV